MAANLQKLLEVSGSCIGEPQLKPGIRVAIKGMKQFDTDIDSAYKVMQATHTFNSSGYITNFTLQLDTSGQPLN